MAPVPNYVSRYRVLLRYPYEFRGEIAQNDDVLWRRAPEFRIAHEHHEIAHRNGGIVTDRQLHRRYVAAVLMDRVHERIPGIATSHDLGPFVAFLVPKNEAAIIFGLDHDDGPSDENDVIDLRHTIIGW